MLMIEKLFEVVNFLLLVGGLWWLSRRLRLGRFVHDYQERIAQELEQARRLEAEAEELHRQAEEELARATDHAEEILESARRMGARAVEEARRAAHLEAERLLAQARQEAALERARVLEELRRGLVAEVIEGARALIEQEMDEEGHRRLVEEFLAGLSPRELQAGLARVTRG